MHHTVKHYTAVKEQARAACRSRGDHAPNNAKKTRQRYKIIQLAVLIIRSLKWKLNMSVEGYLLPSVKT